MFLCGYIYTYLYTGGEWGQPLSSWLELSRLSGGAAELVILAVS